MKPDKTRKRRLVTIKRHAERVAERAQGNYETLYTSPHTPSPASAIDVLAFVLCPNRLMCPIGLGAADVEATNELLNEAKAEAAKRWAALQ